MHSAVRRRLCVVFAEISPTKDNILSNVNGISSYVSKGAYAKNFEHVCWPLQGSCRLPVNPI